MHRVLSSKLEEVSSSRSFLTISQFMKLYNSKIRRIYMDYQASTPIDPRVSEAMSPFFFCHPGNPHASDHSYGWEANAAVEKAAQRVADAISADADEIIFTSGATEANNLAILGLAARASLGRRRILVSAIEHKCVLAAAFATAKRFGCTMETVPVDSNGTLRLDVLKDRLKNDVLLVSVMAVNNEIGTIQPLAAVAALSHEVGALVHTDAVQALTTMNMDVRDLDVDMLSISSHKLYGPKGIGALYIRRNVQKCVEPIIYGGGQQNGLRSGTLPVPLCVGLGEATALVASEEANEERLRIRSLRDNFIERLLLLSPNIRINGVSGDLRHLGNANLCFGGINAHNLLGALQPSIAASTGSACTSGMPEPSHVLRAIGLSIDDANSSIRFSIGRFTSNDDIDESITVINEVFSRISLTGLV